MGEWAREFRLAWRGVSRRPVFAVTAVVTLALGFGAVIAVFALVDTIVLRPLSYPNADRLVQAWFMTPQPPFKTRQSIATFVQMERESRVYDALAIVRPRTVTYVDGDRPERLPSALLTAGIFDVLTVAPQLGRALLRADEEPGADPVVVLSHAFWRDRYGSDGSVIDRRVEVDGTLRRIVGVLPKGTRFPERETAIWLPLTIDRAQPELAIFFYEFLGRLAAGVDLTAAAEDLDRVIRTLPDADPQFFRPEIIESGQVAPRLTRYRDEVLGGTVAVLWVLLGSVGVVLLIAIANVGNLFLVRREDREVELAVRAALGAGRTRVARLLFAESALVAGVGATVGIGLAWVTLQVLLALGPDSLPRLSEVALRPRTLAFAGVVACGVALALTALPGPFRRPPLERLRSDTRTAVGRPRRAGVRKALVTAQVAMSLVLLTGAGLLVRTLINLADIDPGFEAQGIMGARVALDREAYRDWQSVSTFHRELLDALRDEPGVDAAGLTTFLPLRDGRVFLTWDPEERVLVPGEFPSTSLTKAVSEGYLETMGIDLLEGRTVTRRDWGSGAPPVVVVNRVLAERAWPGLSAVGRMLRQEDGQIYEVVGVVGSVRDRDLAAPAPEIAYVPLVERALSAGLDSRLFSVAVRGDRADLPTRVREVVARLDPSVPVFDVRSQERVLADASARVRFVFLLVAASASTALLLGSVGLYGVLAYLVGTRRAEIGLRLALGADRGLVRRQVMGQALTLVIGGIGVGVLVSLPAGRLLGSLLVGVAPTDPVTLVAVASIVLVVSVAAAWVPARRASVVNPAVALTGR